YSTLQAAPAVTSVATNTAFARYQSVPAFMRSYQYTPGFGRGYHTVSVVPPATGTSQLRAYATYDSAPAVRYVYPAASALPRVTTRFAPAASTLVTSPQFARYQTSPGSSRSDKYTPGFGRSYHTVFIVPPVSDVSRSPTFVTPFKLSPRVTTYTTAPAIHRIYQNAPVVANAPGVSQVTKYSSFKSYPASTTAVSKPAFARYQSVPAFMRSYQYTPGFGRGYHTVSVIPPASAVSKLATYATYNTGPAVTTYVATPAVRRIYQAAPVVSGAPAVSRLTKYSSFQSGPAVATVESKPTFSRYQSVPAFMRSYQYTPGFGRGYHTIAVIPPTSAVSNSATYATYNPAPAVTTYAPTPAVHRIYHAAPVVAPAPAVSRVTKDPSFHPDPAIATLESGPAFFRYQSVPAFMRSYEYSHGYGRGYHSVSVVPPAPAVSKPTTYNTYNPSPAVTTYAATPVVRPSYPGTPVFAAAPAVSRLTNYASFPS
ncbi:unnamed protein product, partial [Ixodes hexagonus]